VATIEHNAVGIVVVAELTTSFVDSFSRYLLCLLLRLGRLGTADGTDQVEVGFDQIAESVECTDNDFRDPEYSKYRDE